MEETTKLPPEKELARLWWLNKIGWDSLQLGKDASQFNTVNRSVRKLQDKTFGASESDDAMGDVQVGNTINHYGNQQQSGGMSPIAKTLAALALGGAAGAVTSYMIPGDTAQPIDTNTVTDVTFPE